MESPLFASHPAVDFLNTAFAPDGRPIETIGNGRAFLAWLVRAGLLDAAEQVRLLRRFRGNALDRVATEAREVREWARRWLARWRTAADADYGTEIAFLNKLLARGSYHRVVSKDRVLVEQPGLETADALLAVIAAQIAVLVTQEQPSLLKSCAGTGCTLWFLDRTRAHRRLFCSATACGNRAKVAAFRERERQRYTAVHIAEEAVALDNEGLRAAESRGRYRARSVSGPRRKKRR